MMFLPFILGKSTVDGRSRAPTVIRRCARAAAPYGSADQATTSLAALRGGAPASLGAIEGGLIQRRANPTIRGRSIGASAAASFRQALACGLRRKGDKSPRERAP